MSRQTVLKIGNQQLAMPSQAITDFATPMLRDLVTDLRDTMDADGGVGIAAPQISQNYRLIMFGFEVNKRYPHAKPVPFTILINPVIEVLTDELVDGWEGCLSVPGLRGLVPRYHKIRYSGFDIEGNPVTKDVEDFHARVVQHECDHLDGVLFPQRIKDMKFFGFEDELKDIIWPKER